MNRLRMDLKNKQTNKTKNPNGSKHKLSREGGRVKDATKCYKTLYRTSMDKATPVAMDKNLEKNRGD